MLVSDIFGFRGPDGERLDFVSIMAHGASTYPWPCILERAPFATSSTLRPRIRRPRVFAIPHLQASFVDQNQLRKKECAIVRQLGLEFRGRQAWLLFRSYPPGFFPWFIEGDEVET